MQLEGWFFKYRDAWKTYIWSLQALICITYCAWHLYIDYFIQFLQYSQFSSVQSLSHVQLFATPWITARQASLSITNSWSLRKLMPIKSVMPSSHLILCHPLLLLPSIPTASGSFPVSWLFAWGGQGIGVSALVSALPMNTQDWSPLG